MAHEALLGVGHNCKLDTRLSRQLCRRSPFRVYARIPYRTAKPRALPFIHNRCGAGQSIAPWLTAFLRGIGANWCVCLAIWLALSAKAPARRCSGCWLPGNGFCGPRLRALYRQHVLHTRGNAWKEPESPSLR